MFVLQITDVEATCIPWLIEKAKAYVVLRKNMVRQLCGRLDVSLQFAACTYFVAGSLSTAEGTF
jgi:hypothetical protein